MPCYKCECSHWWKIYFKKNPLQYFLSSLNAVISTNESTEFITGHVIYNPAYTYKFQLKTTKELQIALWMHRFMRIARFNCHAIREVKKPFVKVYKINT